MSNMIPMPPSRVQIGGGAGGPGGPSGGGAPSGGGTPGPDSQAVKQKIEEAIQAIRDAEGMEGDPADQALLAKVVADLRGFIGNQQKMEDTAMGAGPGVKLMRKNAPPSGGGGY